MTARRRLAWLGVAATVSIFTVSQGAPARADEFHYQTLLLGERALGMGGAFTALADDPSASFYNPAGIAHFEVTQLSASLSVYSFDRRVIEDGFGTPVGITDLVSEDNPTLPLFVGAVWKVGPRDRFGVRRFAFALSTLVVDQRDIAYDVDQFNPSSNLDQLFQMQVTDRTIWFGPTVAWRATPRLSFGLSAFLSTRSMTHREERTEVERGERDEIDGVYRNGYLSVRDVTASLSAEHVVLRLGVQAMLGRSWRFGLMVQPPGLQVGSSGSIRERTSFAVDPIGDEPYSTYYRNSQSGLDVESPIPWQVRAGVGFVGGDVFAFDVDFSLYGPSGSANDPVEPLTGIRPDEETGTPPTLPDLFLANWHRVVTFNVSAGMELLVERTVPVRLGVFTNRSAAPAVTHGTLDYRAPDVNQWGGSVSVGFRSGNYDISVGFAGVYGVGRGLRTNPTPGLDALPDVPCGASNPNACTFLPTDVEDRTFFIFLSGHRRAFMRLARDVYGEVF
ncbi:MAG: outer membrane protein transport protein [Deltaproteobacteria bacterium]|nr:outer membrane protein transport protein [Deltaproteobacteria bacterium]